MAQKYHIDIVGGVAIHHKERRRHKAHEPFFAGDGHISTMFHSYMDGTTLVFGAGCATIVEENGKHYLDICGQVENGVIVIS